MFGSATVTAYQGERLLSRGLALVGADEEDLVRHGPSAPDVPGPEELDSDMQSQSFPGSETRSIPDSEATGPDGSPRLDFWVRHPSGAKSVAAAQAILAWAQPGEIIGLAMRPHADVMSIEDAHVRLSTGVFAPRAGPCSPRWEEVGQRRRNRSWLKRLLFSDPRAFWR